MRRSVQTAAALCAAMSMLVLPAAAAAQNGARGDSVAEDAVDAVTQPLEDLNLRSKDIPAILIIAQAAPYDLSAVTGQQDGSDCTLIAQEIMLLEEVLGADVDQEADEDGLVNKGLQLGGSLLGGLLPFRGVIRHLSGANAERAKMNAAIYAGVARRSYLKGYSLAQDCGTAEEIAVQSAEDVLGLSGR